MTKKLVLVQPKSGIYDTMIKDLPLSLLYAAAIVHDKGYDVRIIDQRVEADWKEKLLLELGRNPLCAGISVMTGAPIKFALGVAEIVKEHSKVPIVFGGIHPSIMPDQTLEDEMVDLVVRGEGEETLYELAEALRLGKPLRGIHGLSYKDHGRIIHNPDRGFADVETLPELPYDLIDISHYSRQGYEARIVSAMTSRGCPHNCGFCYAGKFSGRKWRNLSTKKSIEVLQTIIDRFDPGFICLLDDDFFVDLVRAKEILTEIKHRNWKVRFDFRGVRVDDLGRMNDEVLSLLEEIGTRNLHIGAESGSERILTLMRKGIHVQQIIEANRKLRRFPKLVPTYNFFSGVPSETEEDVFMSTDLAFQLLKENPYCHMSVYNQFSPYPGTEMYGLAIEAGFQPPATMRGWAEFDPDNCANSLPWLSKRMVRLLETIYFTSFFIDRKLSIHLTSKSSVFRFFRMLIRMYRPIARFRFRQHFTGFPIELFLKDLFFGYLRRRIDKENEGYFENRLAFDENRTRVWKEIADYFSRFIPAESRVLDLGAGYCDLINNVKAAEKYALDIFSGVERHAEQDVTVLKQSATERIDLPSDYLDVVFASNFFEHLNEREFALVLKEVRRILRRGGRLIVLQPNFRFCQTRYFDDPTHKQVFTDFSLARILRESGFVIEERMARFLPPTLRTRIPKSPWLVRLYLRSPIKPFAGQFLIVAGKVGE